LEETGFAALGPDILGINSFKQFEPAKRRGYRESPGLNTLPSKPYPSVDGIKKTMELYDSLAMRRHKPEDFYDDRFVKELDQSGYIDSLYKKELRARCFRLAILPAPGRLRGKRSSGN
jgi:hypothetical protein